MWDVEWKELSRRLDRWCATAEAVVPRLEWMERANIQETVQKGAARALGDEALAIFRRIDEKLAPEVPDDLREKLDEVKHRLKPLMDAVMRDVGDQDELHVVSSRWAFLMALRAPLDEALPTTEEPRRRRVERAFLHLNRTLTLDEDAQRRWQKAFTQNKPRETTEPRCEKLGALHLLSHGIYSFKAEAISGRTDLVLTDPILDDEELRLTPDVLSVEALVLTEWKLVRDDDDPAIKALQGWSQAEQYARMELADIALRRHRYVVLVSMRGLLQPIGDESHSGVTTHYVNVVIGPLSPSAQAQRVSRSTRSTRQTVRSPSPTTPRAGGRARSRG